jgi:hypothetical protein
VLARYKSPEAFRRQVAVDYFLSICDLPEAGYHDAVHRAACAIAVAESVDRGTHGYLLNAEWEMPEAVEFPREATTAWERFNQWTDEPFEMPRWAFLLAVFTLGWLAIDTFFWVLSWILG